MHQEKHSPEQDCDAQRKTGVSSCNANLQRGFLETKDTEGRGKTETIQIPLCSASIHSVHSIMPWDASVSIGPGISLFSLQPTCSREKRILLTDTKSFPGFVAQITKYPRGAGWVQHVHTHPALSPPLLPCRSRHTTGAEVQDHHRDNSRGAVGALLLPLGRLGDQLHPQGTAATPLALQGAPSESNLNPFPITPFPKHPACICHFCAAHQTPQTASLPFPISFWVNACPQRNVPQKNPVMGKKKNLPASLLLLHPLFPFHLLCNDTSSSSSSLPCSLH